MPLVYTSNFIYIYIFKPQLRRNYIDEVGDMWHDVTRLECAWVGREWHVWEWCYDRKHWTCTSKRLANILWIIIVGFSWGVVCQFVSILGSFGEGLAKEPSWSTSITVVDLGDLHVPSARIAIMCQSGDKGRMQGLKATMLEHRDPQGARVGCSCLHRIHQIVIES